MTNTVAYYDLKFSQILMTNSDKHSSLLRYILKRLVVKHHNFKKIFTKDINRPDPLFGLKFKFEACHTYLRHNFHPLFSKFWSQNDIRDEGKRC